MTAERDLPSWIGVLRARAEAAEARVAALEAQLAEAVGLLRRQLSRYKETLDTIQAREFLARLDAQHTEGET